MRVPVQRFVVLALTLAVGSGALAFTLGGLRWLEPGTTIHTGMNGTSISGITWSTALEAAMDQWSDNTAFTFVADNTNVDPCSGLQGNGGNFPAGNGDGRNSADFRTTVCGNSFGNNVLAVTLNLANQGQLGFGVLFQSDIIFNANYQWNVYDGPRQSRLDFRRVALHELGHVMGLDHEATEPAIMAPSASDLFTLQPDDIAGVNAIYSSNATCLVRDIAPSAIVSDSLEAGDCRVRDLFGGSDDTSFVDVYRLRLEEQSDIDIVMRSSQLDAVLILADANLGDLEIHDDFDGQCDAHIRKQLPAGEYRILANTYVTPDKCAGNIGGYHLTISDSGLPLLGTVLNVTGGATIANTVITGGATADAGGSFTSQFAANQAIDVQARIVPDPVHIGLPGRIYVLAVLSDGRRFMKDSSGRFMLFSGGLSSLVPLRSGVLSAEENVSVINGFRGDATGLAGLGFAVYVGYALNSAPQEIWYGSSPIRFTIAQQ